MSKLRSMASIKVEYGGKDGSSKKYFLMLGIPGRKHRLNIGEIFVDRNEVTHSFMEERFRGLGLGKKLYGEVLKIEKVLYPDSIGGLTPESRRVWDSMKKRYPMTYGKRWLANSYERWGGVKFKN